MEPYDLNVARFLRDHPGHVLTEGEAGFGFRAWLKDGKGRPYGSAVSAATLDELAALLDREQDGRATST